MLGIETASGNLDLIGPRLGYYLWRWKDWTDGEPPKVFASKLLSSMRNALLLLRGFATEHRSTNLDSGVSKRRLVIRSSELQPFVEVSELQKTLAPLLVSDGAGETNPLAQEFAREIRAFRRMLDREAIGRSDDIAILDEDE